VRRALRGGKPGLISTAPACISTGQHEMDVQLTEVRAIRNGLLIERRS
jgi:hypothetical protein